MTDNAQPWRVCVIDLHKPPGSAKEMEVWHRQVARYFAVRCQDLGDYELDHRLAGFCLIAVPSEVRGAIARCKLGGQRLKVFVITNDSLLRFRLIVAPLENLITEELGRLMTYEVGPIERITHAQIVGAKRPGEASQ